MYNVADSRIGEENHNLKPPAGVPVAGVMKKFYYYAYSINFRKCSVNQA